MALWSGSSPEFRTLSVPLYLLALISHKVSTSKVNDCSDTQPFESSAAEPRGLFMTPLHLHSDNLDTPSSNSHRPLAAVPTLGRPLRPPPMLFTRPTCLQACPSSQPESILFPPDYHMYIGWSPHRVHQPVHSSQLG